MMKLLTIFLFLSVAASAKPDSTFVTKSGDVITVKGRDTLVTFAGNWRVDRKTKKSVKVRTKAGKDTFWDAVAIRKQFELVERITQVHGAQRIVKKVVAKKTTVKKK